MVGAESATETYSRRNSFLWYCLDPRTSIVVLTAQSTTVMKSSQLHRRLMEHRSNTPRAVSYVESPHTTVTRIALALRSDGLLLLAILLLVLVLLIGG